MTNLLRIFWGLAAVLVMISTFGASQPAIAAETHRIQTKGMPHVVGVADIAKVADDTDDATHFFYAGVYQWANATGVGASLTQPKPAQVESNGHSLGEIAAESADGRQIVEVGWTVAPSLNGDRKPHLFVFHWINGRQTCYNGCGFVQVSKTIRPGMTVAVTTMPQAYAIRYRLGGWWIEYQGHWVGYFPGSLWHGTYKRIGLAQWFGEVASASASPCTDMGTGRFGHQTGSARMGAIKLFGGPTVSLGQTDTNPAHYDSGHVTASSFTFGGPGSC